MGAFGFVAVASARNLHRILPGRCSSEVCASEQLSDKIVAVKSIKLQDREGKGACNKSWEGVRVLLMLSLLGHGRLLNIATLAFEVLLG